MIVSLLQVALLTMGVGVSTSTPICSNKATEQLEIKEQESNLKYKNYANETQNYTLTFSSSVASHVDNTNTNPTGKLPTQNTNVQLRTGKTKYNIVSNDAIEIESVSYASNYRQYNGSSYLTQYGTLIDDYEAMREWTCAVGTYKFTPYMLNMNNEVTLDFVTRIAVGQATRQLVLRTEYYATQDIRVAQYYDIANWNTQSAIYEIFDHANNTQYTGIYEVKEHPIQTNLSQDVTYQDEINLTIPYIKDGNNIKQTYLFTRSYIYLAHEDNLPDYITTYNKDVNEPLVLGTNHTLTGQMVAASVNIEVVDLPGLLWEILSMPFAFISTAFNLTLFPGTQYQVNIANLFLTIFGVLAFILIFKLLLKR